MTAGAVRRGRPSTGDRAPSGLAVLDADGTLIHLAEMVWDDTLMGVIPFLVEMHRVSFLG